MARIVSRFVALLLALMTVAAGVLLLAEFFEPTICRVMERCMCRSHAGLPSGYERRLPETVAAAG